MGCSSWLLTASVLIRINRDALQTFTLIFPDNENIASKEGERSCAQPGPPKLIKLDRVESDNRQIHRARGVFALSSGPERSHGVSLRFADSHIATKKTIRQAGEVGVWKICTRPPLPRLFKERLVLLGDALHPMPPRELYALDLTYADDLKTEHREEVRR